MDLIPNDPLVSSPRARMVGINHVALEVTDLEEAIGFYASVFGIQSIEREHGMAFLAMGDQFLALRRDARCRAPAGARRHPADDLGDGMRMA